MPGGNRQQKGSALGLWAYAGEARKIQREVLMSAPQNDEAITRNHGQAGQASLRAKGDWGYNGSSSPYILCGKYQSRIHPSICLKKCSGAKKCKWLKDALADRPQQKKNIVGQLELGD